MNPHLKRNKSRLFLAALLTAVVSVLTAGCLVRTLGGAFDQAPEDVGRMSPGARLLVETAFRDVGPEGIFDYHTHVVGTGAGGTGIEIHPSMRSYWHPLHRLKFAIYVSASGIKNIERADEEFVARLLALVRGFPKQSRHMLIAFERYHNLDGTRNADLTELHVPNAYVFDLAERHRNLFVPAISVHPYRSDAVPELEAWARRGVRFVKWLPNAMGIDPSHPKTTAFYATMKKHRMVLITHAGEEKAVEAEDDQRLGNPLLLRKPLNMGLRVVVAHCASLGKNPDLESVGHPPVDNFDLFMRLFSDKRYEGLLFGEISAMTQANRLARPIITLLRRPDLHARLVNGSDYPLPAVNVVIRTGALEGAGLITADERRLLNEIYNYNPLLFDYVTKRTIRDPANRANALSAQIFREHRGLR